MNSAVVPSNSANDRAKNNANGNRNIKTSIANAGNISSKVRSRGTLGAAGRASALTSKDQTVRHWPAQHHRRSDGQWRHARSVLQIDCDRRSAIELHGITQDIAEKRASAHPSSERVGLRIAAT